MGFSGVLGKVYFIDTGCPVLGCEGTGWESPSGTANCWNDEVTRFTLVDSVSKREYGHDKSLGWQDVVAGTRRCGITLDAMLRPDDTAHPVLQAGKIVWLQLYPYGITGACATPLEGYAMIDQISYTYDQESGQPISYSATLSSKGPWTGFTSDSDWGGFECSCTPT